MNNYKIGDCVELLKDVPRNSIDCMVTDPPYGIGYVSNRCVGENPHKGIVNDVGFDAGFNTTWLSQASTVLKPTSAVMVFTRWDLWGEWCLLISKHWDIKNMVVWVKNSWTAGDLSGNMGYQHELIIFASRGNFKINGHRYPNVWNFDRVPPKRHPTEKPVALIERAVKMCCGDGGTVLDPFLGSGTTLEACYRTDRGCIGFEVDEKYEQYYADRGTGLKGNLFDYV